MQMIRVIKVGSATNRSWIEFHRLHYGIKLILYSTSSMSECDGETENNYVLQESQRSPKERLPL